MTDEVFNNEYRKLNIAQKEAVDTIEGPVIVLAGPGTGKTQILTLRIANILLKTQINPENILALTFTENAANNMRKRLSTIIGSGAYQVAITTFHGFCNDIIGKYAHYFDHLVGSEPITEVEEIELIEEILFERSFTYIKPYADPTHYVHHISSAIRNLKRESIDPTELVVLLDKEKEEVISFDDLINEKGKYAGQMKVKYVEQLENIEKNREVQYIYTEYEKRLREKRQYDFSDMILEVMKAFKENETLLRIVQEQYQYILVDEHQDTNKAQENIIKLISSYFEEPNLFVVGDEKQSIFRFQGASVENFLYFHTIYPSAKVITLTHNYRSTSAILSQAHTLFPKSNELTSVTDSSISKISYTYIPTKLEEAYTIANHIKKNISQDKTAAILVTKNSDAQFYYNALQASGIHAELSIDDSLLKANDVQVIIGVLRAINNFGSDPELAYVLHTHIFPISALDVVTVINNAQTHKQSIIEELKAINIDSSIYKEAQILLKTLNSWAEGVYTLSLVELIKKIITESGIVERALISSEKDTASILSFYTFVEELYSKGITTLTNLLNYIDRIERHNILLKITPLSKTQSNIYVMTVHKSKGLEFNNVYIPNFVQGVWGNKRNIQKIKLPKSIYAKNENNTEMLDDEKRLLYVALTRAKEHILLTIPKKSTEGKELLPSKFLTELDINKMQEENDEEIVTKIQDITLSLFSKSEGISANTHLRELIVKLFHEKPFSATALNNYLSCPWKYVYRNLIHIPEVKTPSLLFGSLIHSAFSYAHNMFKEGSHTLSINLLKGYAIALNKLAITEQDRIELMQRGKKVLESYAQAHPALFTKHTLTDFKLKGVLPESTITIEGFLDKLEFPNGNSEVIIVDYKTGFPKSSNAIMGNTKDSDGNYYRQLVFYTMLMQEFEKRYTCIGCALDFVEPTDSGEYKRVPFTITLDEQRALKEQLFKVWDDIENTRFFDSTCNDKDCEYCKLAKFLKSAN